MRCKTLRQSGSVLFPLLLSTLLGCSHGEITANGLDAGRLAKITPAMKSYVEKGTLAGVVTLVSRHGVVGHLEAVGYQDLDRSVPMRSNTIFDIRSMTKPVTAVAIMILIEEERLALDDPVEKYLPEFTDMMVLQRRATDHATSLRKPLRSITIRDLLTHSSGMSAARPDSLRDLTVKMNHTLAEVVSIYARVPLEFDPGTELRYSSLGFATLGRIIEVISGEPYEKFVEKHIFKPLEMKDSFFFPPPEKWDRIAVVYSLQGGKLKKFPIDIYRAGMKYSGPDFGMYSTAADLAAFYQMMLNNGLYEGKRILSSRTVEEMISCQSPASRFLELLCYGLGWQRVNRLHAALRLTAVGMYGHSGYFGTAGWIDPTNDFIRIFLMQREGGSEEEINEFMRLARSAIVN